MAALDALVRQECVFQRDFMNLLVRQFDWSGLTSGLFHWNDMILSF
jgi:hypothetical protein